MDLHGSATTTGRVNFERPEGRISEEKIRAEQYPDATKRQTPQCPECKACFNPRIQNGWANDRELKLREYICAVCGTIYATVELVLPVGPRVTHYDEQRTQNHRNGARRRRGYAGGPPRGERGRRVWATIKGWALKVHDPDTGQTTLLQEGTAASYYCRRRDDHDHD